MPFVKNHQSEQFTDR